MGQNKKQRNVNVYNLLIIDESGSMHKIYEQALSGINETINTIRGAQKKYPDQHHFVSVVSFEGQGPQGVKTRRPAVPADLLGRYPEPAEGSSSSRARPGISAPKMTFIGADPAFKTGVGTVFGLFRTRGTSFTVLTGRISGKCVFIGQKRIME